MKKKATLILQQKRDIWQVINATFSFLTVTFKALYRDVLLISGPFYILAGIFSSLSSYNIIFRSYTSYDSNPFSTYKFFTPAYWVYLLCLLIGWSLSTCIIGNHVYQYRLHGGPGYDVQEARRGIKKDIMRVIFGNFLNLLIIGAAGLLVLVPVLISGASNPFLTGLGVMIFMIPAIYLAVANSLLTVILILDKEIFMVDAFSESRRLIRNNWWRAVLLGIVIGIITVSIEKLFTWPAQIFSLVVLFHSTQGNEMESYSLLFIALNALASLGLTIVAPVSVVCSAIFYYSLKEKKDHVALIENIDKIGVQEAKVETETKEKEDEGDF